MLKYLIKEWFGFIGGFLVGFSIPFSSTGIIFKNSLMDFLLLFPIGIIMIAMSYYYNFIKK